MKGAPTSTTVSDGTVPNCSPRVKATTLPRFIMDYSMNKIAKYLRLLGYDTICDPHVAHDQIIALAAAEGRTLISSSTSLLVRVDAHNRSVHRRAQTLAKPQPRRVVAYDSDGDSIYSESSELAEVPIDAHLVRQWRSKEFHATMIDLIRRTGLGYDPSLVFSRCVTCNDLLIPVARDLVRDRVEPSIYAMYPEFTECPTCRKIFWGVEGDTVVNYKSFRTLDLLRSLCRSAGTPVQAAVKSLGTLQSFRSFPRRVKAEVFGYLSDEDLANVSEVFPVLAGLAAEVRDCRNRGLAVAPFKAVKGSR